MKYLLATIAAPLQKKLDASIFASLDDKHMLITIFIVGVFCFVVGRIIIIRSKRLLSAEQKTVVADAPARRPWFLIGLLVLLVGWAFIRDQWWSLGVFWGSMFLLSMGVAVANFRRLTRLELPSAYLRSARMDLFLSGFGLFLLVAAMLYREWTKVHH